MIIFGIDFFFFFFQFMDIKFKDFVSDPLAMSDKIYDHLGMEVFFFFFFFF